MTTKTPPPTHAPDQHTHEHPCAHDRHAQLVITMTTPALDERTNDNDHARACPHPRKRRRRRIHISSDEESEKDEVTDLTGRLPEQFRPHTNARANAHARARNSRLRTTTLTKNLALIINRHKHNDINFTHPNPGAIFYFFGRMNYCRTKEGSSNLQETKRAKETARQSS